MPRHVVPKPKRRLAKRLRRKMTDAELRLWIHLRNRADLRTCDFAARLRLVHTSLTFSVQDDG
jgi:very-short-patch-repair endonuclease